MTEQVNLRGIVLDMLLAVTKDHQPSHVVHRQMLEKYAYLEKQERNFISRLFNGTLDRMITLDYCIDQFSSVKVSKMRPAIADILRLSIYQMFYMSHVPVSAVCNEAVKLAGKRGFGSLKGFVNGVLRAISRKRQEIKWPDQETEPLRFLSVAYSAPDWMVKLFVENYGQEAAEKILEASLQDRPLSIRCAREDQVEETKNILNQEGVAVEESKMLPYALHISGFDTLQKLDSFQSGLYMVQDEGSMLVVEMANLQKGDTVLDVCAAPGGKSCHAAARLAALNDGQSGPGLVIARDLSERKIELIEENKERLGITNMTIEVADALESRPQDRESAQVVLADLPCSGLGVLAKKPDIKYTMTQEKMKQLANLQRRILSVVQEDVAPHGKLVYSTCTLNPEENTGNISWFLQNFDFALEESRLLIPGVDPCDGFYIAVLRRKSN